MKICQKMQHVLKKYGNKSVKSMSCENINMSVASVFVTFVSVFVTPGQELSKQAGSMERTRAVLPSSTGSTDTVFANVFVFCICICFCIFIVFVFVFVFVLGLCIWRSSPSRQRDGHGLSSEPARAPRHQTALSWCRHSARLPPLCYNAHRCHCRAEDRRNIGTRVNL